MRPLVTITLLVGASMLALACGQEHRRSADDDDGFITETTLGGNGNVGGQTSGPTTSGSGGASQSVGAGGSTSTSSTSSTGAGGTGGAGVQVGDLVITEIMNNPAAVLDADGEWFELHNASTHAIDLAGMAIRHTIGSPNAHAIASSVIVPPGGYVVLARNGDYATNGGVNVAYVYDGSVSLNNTNDYLAIALSDGTIIDETSWDELSGLDPDGASRSLDPASTSASFNDDDTNFCEASSPMPFGDTGTPGSANDGC